MPKVSRPVRFYEVRDDAGNALAEITDLEEHFFDVVASLDPKAPMHWQGDSGVRTRGRVFRATPGAKPTVDMVIVDKVHREPPFSYWRSGGNYDEHAFPDPDTQFAEPKFLAFFEKNLVATFTAGLRIEVAEASLNVWRVEEGLAPISLRPVIDLERVQRLASAHTVQSIDLDLPADMAREIYRDRNTPLATFLRSQAVRNGQIGVRLSLDVEDPGNGMELLEELKFLVEEEERYVRVAGAERATVRATYRTEDGSRPRSHDFLGQALGMSVTVDIAEPELGPQPHVASEALMRAFTKKRDTLVSVTGGG